MARVWAEGFELGEINSIYLVGGIRDGEIINRPDLPPEICLRRSGISYLTKEEMSDLMPGQMVRYKRVGITLNYVCLDWFE
jgi:hypothetical protein